MTRRDLAACKIQNRKFLEIRRITESPEFRLANFLFALASIQQLLEKPKWEGGEIKCYCISNPLPFYKMNVLY